MLKAGALYYAILVSFLVALLSGFLMINIRFHHFHMQNLIQSQRMERNIKSALVIAKETPSAYNPSQPVTIDLYNDETDEVMVTKKQWGGFYLLKAEASWRQVQHSAIEMCGNDIFCDEPVALYLADKERYLSISGNTNLKGNCYIPKLGIRRAYIEGASYTGKEMIHGKTQISKSSLPEIDPLFSAGNRNYLTGSNFPADSLVAISRLLKSDSINNSFYQKTVIFYSDLWITLANKSLKGNIRVVSSRGVTLGNKSEIQDIIVYAPKIEVESGFLGSVQLFATDSIIVRKNTKLLFPSLISILATKSKNPYIEIEKECKISGDIVLLSQNGNNNTQAECDLDEESAVNGRIYCDGSLQFKGAVNGSVYCTGFILRTPSSLYENHLLNVTIDFPSLSKYYSGAGFFKVSDRYKAIKWLY